MKTTNEDEEKTRITF